MDSLPDIAYDSYLVMAYHDPSPEQIDHVQIRVGIGDEGQAAGVYLEICSHGLDKFIADIRRAQRMALQAGGKIVVVSDDNPDGIVL